MDLPCSNMLMWTTRKIIFIFLILSNFSNFSEEWQKKNLPVITCCCFSFAVHGHMLLAAEEDRAVAKSPIAVWMLRVVVCQVQHWRPECHSYCFSGTRAEVSHSMHTNTHTHTYFHRGDTYLCKKNVCL